jgi:hypothetical protein
VKAGWWTLVVLVLALGALSVSANSRTPTPTVNRPSGPDKIVLRRADHQKVRISVHKGG